MKEVNTAAQAKPGRLRLSLDAKATVAVGDYSRHGQSRCQNPVQALDHDMQPKTKLIPFGILNLETSDMHIRFGSSHKTSDFVVDCLHQWWESVADRYWDITELILNCDNGPESNSQRTQFLKRIVEFSDATGLRIHLVYYPPYHSKYNPIERCWAALEQHWNGTLLTTIETTLNWAKTMTWKGCHPVVTLCETNYQKGITLGKQALAEIESRLQRHPLLPKWDVIIEPVSSV